MITSAAAPDHIERVTGNATTKLGQRALLATSCSPSTSKVGSRSTTRSGQAGAVAGRSTTRPSSKESMAPAVASCPTGRSPRATTTSTPRCRRSSSIPKERRPSLQQAGYKNEDPIVIETTVGYIYQRPSRCRATIQGMWRDVRHQRPRSRCLEYFVRAQKNWREPKSFKGLGGSRSDLHPLRSRRHDVAAARLPAGRRTTGATPASTSWATRRGSRWTRSRGQAYKEMTKIFVEHFPWLLVVRPSRTTGCRRSTSSSREPQPAVRVRPFNFKFKRA